MFNFNSGSGWSLEMELECFLIFKKLEEASFLRGMQTELCNELASRSNLSLETVKAKVGNFKSEAGVTNESNSSKATIYIVENFGHFSAPEAEALLKGYQLYEQSHA